jgi:hypothetical protein
VSAQLAGLPASGQTAWPPAPAPAWPQPPAPQVKPTLPPNAAQLDTLLTTKQYLQLGQLLRQTSAADAIVLNMNWQREKMLAGASAFINFSYAWDLWRMAEAVPPAQGSGLKEMAVLVALYGVALIAIDGVKCQDVSAPGHRRTQILTTYPYIWKHAPTLPVEKRTLLVQTALRLEQSTAARRPDDDFLCRDGLDQMQHALKQNAGKPLQEAPQPGQLGKTMIIPAAPDYQPKFQSRDAWLPKQTEARAAMPKILSELMEKLPAPKQ